MIENPFDFSNQVVLVTGAAKGIGSGIAQRFAQAGAKVALHHFTSASEANALVAAIQGAGGYAAAFQADLTQAEQVTRLIEKVWDHFGQLDILINNAGQYPVTNLLEMSSAEWESVLNANLLSAFLCLQAAARRMVAAKRAGVIINIASIEGSFPAWGHSHYNAAKAGVLMLTRSAALELGRHQIRVNAVSPGLIWRPGLEQAWPEGVRAWKDAAPLERLGQPEDVANACLFLASSAAGWITGANLVVDGGIATRPAF